MRLRAQGPDEGGFPLELEALRPLRQRYAGCAPAEDAHRVDDAQVTEDTHPGPGAVQVELLEVDREPVAGDLRRLPDPASLLTGPPQHQHLSQARRRGSDEPHRQRPHDVGATGDDERFAAPHHLAPGLDVDSHPPRRGSAPHVVGHGARRLDDLEPAPLADPQPYLDLVTGEQQRPLGDERDPRDVTAQPEEPGGQVGPSAGAIGLDAHAGRRRPRPRRAGGDDDGGAAHGIPATACWCSGPS